MSETLNPQTEAKPNPITIGEEDFKDEEIDVAVEEGSEEAKAEEPAKADAEPERHKRRGPKRVAALTHERDEARAYAADIAAELERERARSKEFEIKANEASTVAMQSFAAKSESDLKEARAAHSAALSSGDAARITEAAEQLASAKATMDDVEAWKKTESAKPAQKVEERAAAPQQQQIQDLPPNLKEWAAKNRYWDQNARDESGELILDRAGRTMKNKDFDEEMHIEATIYATKLERQIASGRLKAKVGDATYLKMIDDHQREEFPDYFGESADEVEEEEVAAPRRRSSSPVAPVSRSAPNQRSGPSRKMTISGDEVRFVKKMVENGGGPKYPQGHPKQFQPMTFDDAKVSFVRQKMAQAADKQ